MKCKRISKIVIIALIISLSIGTTSYASSVSADKEMISIDVSSIPNYQALEVFLNDISNKDDYHSWYYDYFLENTRFDSRGAEVDGWDFDPYNLDFLLGCIYKKDASFFSDFPGIKPEIHTFRDKEIVPDPKCVFLSDDMKEQNANSFSPKKSGNETYCTTGGYIRYYKDNFNWTLENIFNMNEDSIKKQVEAFEKWAVYKYYDSGPMASPPLRGFYETDDSYYFYYPAEFMSESEKSPEESDIIVDNAYFDGECYYIKWHHIDNSIKEYSGVQTKVIKNNEIWTLHSHSDSHFIRTDSEMDYLDVNENDWFQPSVKFVYDRKIMNGIDANTFAPNEKSSRSMIVTLLYRLEGEPEINTASGFSDVPPGKWYTDAVSWAVNNNIVNGVNSTTFAPDSEITREQFVTILYRYSQYKQMNMDVADNLEKYKDNKKVSAYALPAMKWAVGSGLINGIDGLLSPETGTTRAQAAAILQRYCEQ